MLVLLHRRRPRYVSLVTVILGFKEYIFSSSVVHREQIRQQFLFVVNQLVQLLDYVIADPVLAGLVVGDKRTRPKLQTGGHALRVVIRRVKPGVLHRNDGIPGIFQTVVLAIVVKINLIDRLNIHDFYTFLF